METLRLDAAGFTDAQLAPAVAALRQGEVIAYPTDTLYGLGADPRDRRAVAALFAAKGRAEGHALPLIASDVAQVREVGVLSRHAERLASLFWPGPLTLVLQGVAQLADGVAARDSTVAVRVPDLAIARSLASQLAFPITATSANRSGEPATRYAADVATAFSKGIALLIDAGPTPGGTPSTIVDVTNDVPRLVREGAVAWNRVLESLQ